MPAARRSGTRKSPSETDGAVEAAGDALGLAKRRIEGDLERFKELIEKQGSESGAWRGEVEQDPTT